VPFALVTNAKLILTDRLIAASRPVDAWRGRGRFRRRRRFGATDAFLEEQED
jgi:ribosome maturation factor RimP